MFPATTAAAFPSTKWTWIERIRNGSPQDRDSALEELCRAYWLPLYAFARHTGLDTHTAQDAVQGFVMDLLARGLFHEADHAKGKLRSLLLTAFRRYLGNLKKRENCQSRGGLAKHISISQPEAEKSLGSQFASLRGAPDEVFHRKWAETVARRTLERLQDHYEQHGKSARFRVMRQYLPWDGSEDEDTAAGASAAGMTPGAFRTAVHRLRDRYREMVYEEVSQTIGSSDPEVIEHEIRELFKTLAS